MEQYSTKGRIKDLYALIKGVGSRVVKDLKIAAILDFAPLTITLMWSEKERKLLIEIPKSLTESAKATLSLKSSGSW